jgi:hypothetical protein
MKVRIIHLGETYWLVRQRGLPLGPVYRFDPGSPYRRLEFAAQRSYMAYGDLIEVDEVHLEPYAGT